MRVALLDADIIAYKAAAASERLYDWDGDGAVSCASDLTRAVALTDKTVDELADRLRAQRVVVCLSDEFRNFRSDIYADYKSNRAAIRRPELLYEIKDYLAKTFDCRMKPGLEADDVMGILATEPSDEDRIIVSEDKDMRTIPSKVYDPNRPQNGIMKISPLDADRFHCWQTIVGDPVDGYPGAYGVGKRSVYAEDIITAEREELWDTVLMAFSSVGLDEQDAVVQARCARILRWGDYDESKGEPVLWTPALLSVD